MTTRATVTPDGFEAVVALIGEHGIDAADAARAHGYTASSVRRYAHAVGLDRVYTFALARRRILAWLRDRTPDELEAVRQLLDETGA